MAVERGSGLVKHQDGRRLENRAGNGDTLLLAAGKLQAALAHLGLVSLGRQSNEVVNLGEPRRLLDFCVARFPAAVADVVADRIIKQDCVLRHDPDCRSQRMLRDIANILTIDGNAPTAELVEAKQQA